LNFENPSSISEVMEFYVVEPIGSLCNANTTIIGLVKVKFSLFYPYFFKLTPIFMRFSVHTHNVVLYTVMGKNMGRD
jgi:hypothetical protein